MVVFLSYLILNASKNNYGFSGGSEFVEALIFGIVLIVVISAAVSIINGFKQVSKKGMATFNYKFIVKVTLEFFAAFSVIFFLGLFLVLDILLLFFFLASSVA